jgi:hypothetical protein
MQLTTIPPLMMPPSPIMMSQKWMGQNKWETLLRAWWMDNSMLFLVEEILLQWSKSQVVGTVDHTRTSTCSSRANTLLSAQYSTTSTVVIHNNHHSPWFTTIHTDM